MNDKTRDNRGLWDAGALAVAAAVTVLATACGGGSAPSAASTPTAYTQQTLAHRGSSIDVGSSQVQAAYDGCQYLQPGAPSIGQLEQKVRQARQNMTTATS